MCNRTYTKYACGHKSHRYLKRCFVGRMMGSADGSCGHIGEERLKSSRLCVDCSGEDEDEYDHYVAESHIAAERARAAEKLEASSSRAFKREGKVLRPIENKAPPRLHERAFLDQGNREPLAHDSSSRRKSRASGLKAPTRHSERAPVIDYETGLYAGLNFSKPPKRSDRYVDRKSIAVVPKAKDMRAKEETRSRKKSIFGGLFSRDSDASFACVDARKIEAEGKSKSKSSSSRRKSRW